MTTVNSNSGLCDVKPDLHSGLSWPLTSIVCLAAAVLILLYPALHIPKEVPDGLLQSVSVSPIAQPFSTVPIETVKLGQRVLANNPLLDNLEYNSLEPDWSAYLQYTLRVSKESGGNVLAEFLRPPDHFPSEVGSQFEIQLPEIGVDGKATVLDVKSAPIVGRGLGKVVTGTFRHSEADILGLYVSSDSEVIGVTPTHPIWSENHQDFIPASQLQVGDTLLAADNSLTTLTKIVPRGPPQPVFNIEVDTEHVYFVGQSGVLVHNVGCGQSFSQTNLISGSYFKKKTEWQSPRNGTGYKYSVYQQEIDWDLRVKINGKNFTNRQLALDGRPPYIIKNGKKQQIQLHHSRQNAKGPLYELSRGTHQSRKGMGREALHPYGNNKNPDYPVDRSRFDTDRGQYWKDRLAADGRGNK